MSNPAVITLVNVSGNKHCFRRFQIEDNIGESIHLHIDNLRVDFSISEFLDFSHCIKKSLMELDLFHGHDIDDFDSRFLHECGNLLYRLSKITIEKVSLSDLRFIVRDKVTSDLLIHRAVSVEKTPAFRYLKGDRRDFLSYHQFSYFGDNNEDRLLDLVKSIKENKYPYKNKHIVLFNGQNIVRDGQHRAAVLAHMNGTDARINVMRFHFDGRQHRFTKNLNNAKSIVRWISKKIYSKLWRIERR